MPYLIEILLKRMFQALNLIYKKYEILKINLEFQKLSQSITNYLMRKEN